MSTIELTGRALDAEVAVKVFGWKAVKCAVTGRGCWRTDDCGNIILAENWNPSSSPDAAMKVVEKMRERNLSFWCGRGWGKCGWVAQFSNDSGAFYEYADTFPEAVCRAAMAAVEGESK